MDALGNAYIAGSTASLNFPTTSGAFQTTLGRGFRDAFVSKFSFGVPFSCLSVKLEIDEDTDAFGLKATFKLGPGGAINPLSQPVSASVGPYSVTIPQGSFVKE